MKNDHQSKKIDRLDNAFLFVLGSAGLVISFIQITMKSLTELIEAIPFLLFGIVLPFYVGYMRGAIEIDSVEERMRGWIYFIIGTSSYFAFFIFRRVHAEYIYQESVFILLITFGLLITYLLLRWSRKVFRVSGTSSQYAFSGTALCAIGATFLIRLVVSLYLDFQDKNIYELVLRNPSEFLFWISIILASLSIVLIFEKASRSALQTELELPKLKGRLVKLRKFFLVKGLLLGLMLLEYAFDFNLKACFLWLQAFAFWVLGCFVWVARIPLFPPIFFLLTVIFMLIAGALYYKMGTISFENIEDTIPSKSADAMLIFVAIITMVFSSSLQLGALLIMLIIIFGLLTYQSSQRYEK